MANIPFDSRKFRAGQIQIAQKNPYSNYLQAQQKAGQANLKSFQRTRQQMDQLHATQRQTVGRAMGKQLGAQRSVDAAQDAAMTTQRRAAATMANAQQEGFEANRAAIQGVAEGVSKGLGAWAKIEEKEAVADFEATKMEFENYLTVAKPEFGRQINDIPYTNDRDFTKKLDTTINNFKSDLEKYINNNFDGRYRKMMLMAVDAEVADMRAKGEAKAYSDKKLKQKAAFTRRLDDLITAGEYEQATNLWAEKANLFYDPMQEEQKREELVSQVKDNAAIRITQQAESIANNPELEDSQSIAAGFIRESYKSMRDLGNEVSDDPFWSDQAAEKMVGEVLGSVGYNQGNAWLSVTAQSGDIGALEQAKEEGLSDFLGIEYMTPSQRTALETRLDQVLMKSYTKQRSNLRDFISKAGDPESGFDLTMFREMRSRDGSESFGGLDPKFLDLVESQIPVIMRGVREDDLAERQLNPNAPIGKLVDEIAAFSASNPEKYSYNDFNEIEKQITDLQDRASPLALQELTLGYLGLVTGELSNATKYNPRGAANMEKISEPRKQYAQQTLDRIHALVNKYGAVPGLHMRIKGLMDNILTSGTVEDGQWYNDSGEPVRIQDELFGDLQKGIGQEIATFEDSTVRAFALGLISPQTAVERAQAIQTAGSILSASVEEDTDETTDVSVVEGEDEVENAVQVE